MEESLIKAALGNGLWAALFVFMLVYVLKTSGEREKQLTTTLSSLAEKYGILEDVKAGMQDVKSGVDRIERKVEILIGGERHGR